MAIGQYFPAPCWTLISDILTEIDIQQGYGNICLSKVNFQPTKTWPGKDGKEMREYPLTLDSI